MLDHDPSTDALPPPSLLDLACNWLAEHPRWTTALTCTLAYAAFWFAGAPT